MTDNRVFNYAVLLSVALHGLLLFGFQNLPDPARRAVRFPPPILARLVEPEAAAVSAPAPAPAPEPVQQAAAPRPKKPAPAVAKPAPELPSTSAPPIPAAPSSGPPSAEAASPSVAPAPTPLASIDPRAPSAAPSAEVSDARSLGEYRMELIEAARRVKDSMRYPPLARDNNWEADVLVGVVIGTNGKTLVSVKASSGYDVLDQQALEIYRRATQLVSIPSALRGKESALKDLPVEYRLVRD